MSFAERVIGGISDEHIVEFAFVKPKRIYTGVLMRVAAAAACLAVVFAGVPWAWRTISSLPVFSVSSNIITDCWAEPENKNNARVVFDGKTYLFDNDDLSRIPKQLREEYEYVGDVLTVDPKSSNADGYSLGCSVGDPIYMDPDFPGEIYVFTKFFFDDIKYVRFTDLETHEKLGRALEFIHMLSPYILFNNKYYYSFGPEYSYELSNRYLLIDTIDSESIYLYGRKLDVGDKIFQDPDHPEEIYDYRKNHGYELSGYIYRRYVDFEAWRQEGKIKDYADFMFR